MWTLWCSGEAQSRGARGLGPVAINVGQFLPWPVGAVRVRGFNARAAPGYATTRPRARELNRKIRRDCRSPAAVLETFSFVLGVKKWPTAGCASSPLPPPRTRGAGVTDRKASVASVLCPVTCPLRLNPHSTHIQVYDRHTHDAKRTAPDGLPECRARGRPLSPLITRRAATLTRAPSPSHALRPHAPPSHALPSHALPLRITSSESGAADPYLNEAVVARGGHGGAIRRHRHRGHVPGWGWR